jgi:glycosyltransferase involved in cell wall biosynthesis
MTAGAPRMLPSTAIVVPCYNEAARLPADAFVAFAAQHPALRLVFVNDGSADATATVLRQLAQAMPGRADVIDLSRNQGKAEAVRTGMQRAFAANTRYAGYWDADLSTPLREIPRLVDVLERHAEREICFGARVRLLGRHIERRTARHYLGRVFATAASMTLGLPVYDTQCGAKIFRASPDIAALFDEPFVTGWTFDIEIIARLARARARSGGPGPAEVIYELPLEEWLDIEGSKVRPLDFVTGLLALGRIRRTYRS